MRPTTSVLRLAAIGLVLSASSVGYAQPAFRTEKDLLGEKQIPPTPTTASRPRVRWRTFRSRGRPHGTIPSWSRPWRS